MCLTRGESRIRPPASPPSFPPKSFPSIANHLPLNFVHQLQFHQSNSCKSIQYSGSPRTYNSSALSDFHPRADLATQISRTQCPTASPVFPAPGAPRYYSLAQQESVSSRPSTCSCPALRRNSTTKLQNGLPVGRETSTSSLLLSSVAFRKSNLPFTELFSEWRSACHLKRWPRVLRVVSGRASIALTGPVVVHHDCSHHGPHD